jgi:hypothetical protein
VPFNSPFAKREASMFERRATDITVNMFIKALLLILLWLVRMYVPRYCQHWGKL